MFAEVVVDILNSEVDRIFDYEIGSVVPAGTRVLVPFGQRKLEGFVLKVKDKTSLDKSKIKKVISFDETPLILPEMLELVDFMTQNYNLRKMDAIRLFVPSGIRTGKLKQKLLALAKIKDENFDANSFKSTAKNQKACYEYLKTHKTEKLSTLNDMFSPSSVKKLIELNLIEIFYEKEQSKLKDYGIIQKKVTLTETQSKIVKTITQKADKYLLFGVTGSGKTEVYMNVIQNALNEGKTAIMLVPEISLTPQVLKNFKAKFGNDVAILHSGLSVRERFDEWFRILNCEAKVVVCTNKKLGCDCC